MTLSSKRAEYLALGSLILGIIFFGISFLIGRWSGFLAIWAVCWLMLSAGLIWLVLTIQFHQRALAEQEKLDMSQLEAEQQAPRMFEAEGEQATLFAVAQRRLGILERWFIPIFAALIAAYQVGLGLYLFRAVRAPAETEFKQPLLCAVVMVAIAFASFLISRYATGMSAQLKWKPLRAGGSHMLGVALLCFALAIGLALVQFDIFVVLTIIGWIIPILLLILGLETALNVVLDIYRPRLKGQYPRAAFDSRLLGLINEPGEIFRTAASAIDYQFGFKVSQTWFYKLLEKAIIPLVLFAAVTLYLFSCIIVVGPNEEAIVEHFGNPLYEDGQVRHMGPGLSLKWPWPIDIAHKRNTKTVSEISVGFVPAVRKEADQAGYGPLLWGKTHYEKEYRLLVASEQVEAGSSAEAVPVSLVMAAVPVQYRIKDLYSFIYNHDEPEKLLESICYRELTKFAASAKIEVDSEADLQHSLLGAGRNEAKQVLTKNIQAAADAGGLGVEIVFLGLQGIHPPPEVATDYQQVVGAVQKKQALILQGEAERNESLGVLVGSVQEAQELYDLAAKYQRAERRDRPQDVEKLAKDLDKAFSQAEGDIFAILRQAQSYAFEKATLAKATSERFASQVKAYRAAPEIYKREERLMALQKGLADIRKFIVVPEPNDTEIFIIDLQEKLDPDMYDIAGLQENSGQ
jgi:regulator of protease activity HflC (stomatin/prohibitin superfamily)